MPLLSSLRGQATRNLSFQQIWGADLDWAQVAGTSVGKQAAIAATLACVDLKAASIAAMPLHEYRETGTVRERVAKSPVLDDPSQVFSPEEWVYATVASLELWDEAILYVTEIDRNGWPRFVEPLVPSTVSRRRDGMTVTYNVAGEDTREWRHGGRVIHIRRRPVPGALNGGLSTAKAVAPLIAVGTEGAKAIAAHYIGGGMPLAVLSWDGDLKDSESERISERFEQRRRRHPGRPLVFGRGYKLDIVPRGDVAKDMVEMRKQIATEIAVARSVQPEWVGGSSGGSMTYSNLEALTRALEVRTLLPVYSPLERTLSRNLLPQPRFCRFNADAIVRTNLLDRMRAYDVQIRNGMQSRDEARAIEDRPPIPDGSGGEFVNLARADKSDARELAEVVQKLYLGVGSVITSEEARVILQAAGADISGDLSAEEATP